MTNLTTVFGNDIAVACGPSIQDMQFSAFAGANGLTALDMGSRGNIIVVTGIIYSSSNLVYSAARAQVEGIITSIKTWLGGAENDYTFQGSNYYGVVFLRFDPIPDGQGRQFQFTPEGRCLCRFVCTGRSLV